MAKITKLLHDISVKQTQIAELTRKVQVSYAIRTHFSLADSDKVTVGRVKQHKTISYRVRVNGDIVADMPEAEFNKIVEAV